MSVLPRWHLVKLGTWDGVFMPVSLNILGIILFLRFGFILGQAGLLGALFLLVLSYAIDTLTAMSLNAIRQTVRSEEAAHIISSLALSVQNSAALSVSSSLPARHSMPP